MVGETLVVGAGGGCVAGGVELPPPLHPMNAIVNVPASASARPRRRRGAAQRQSPATNPVTTVRPTPAAKAPAVRAVVEIVSVACTEPAPGATAGGLNEQLAPGGRFEHASVTLFANAPPCADTVTWYAADCPALTVADAGVAATPKFVTVI